MILILPAFSFLKFLLKDSSDMQCLHWIPFWNIPVAHRIACSLLAKFSISNRLTRLPIHLTFLGSLCTNTFWQTPPVSLSIIEHVCLKFPGDAHLCTLVAWKLLFLLLWVQAYENEYFWYYYGSPEPWSYISNFQIPSRSLSFIYKVKMVYEFFLYIPLTQYRTW